MNLEKHQIIELANGKEYAIVEKYEEKNREYLMLLEMDGEEVTDSVSYVEIIRNESGINIRNLSIEEEQDISEVFVPLFEQEYVNIDD